MLSDCIKLSESPDKHNILNNIKQNYLKLSSRKERIRPFSLKSLGISTGSPFLYITMNKILLDYMVETQAFCYREKPADTAPADMLRSEYPLSLVFNSSFCRNAEQVFFYDFIRRAIEINGVGHSLMSDWEIVREACSSDSDSDSSDSSKEGGGLVESKEDDDIKTRTFILDLFLKAGFTIKDINSVFKSYQQVLLYTDKYLLESLFPDIFFTHKDFDLSPEDKWHIQSQGLSCRLNIYKRRQSVFAELGVSNINLIHVNRGEYSIPGEIKTYYYLDQSIIGEVPTWRLYKNYTIDRSVLYHMSFLQDINNSLDSYLKTGDVNKNLEDKMLIDEKYCDQDNNNQDNMQVDQSKQPDNFIYNNPWQLVFLSNHNNTQNKDAVDHKMHDVLDVGVDVDVDDSLGETGGAGGSGGAGSEAEVGSIEDGKSWFVHCIGVGL